MEKYVEFIKNNIIKISNILLNHNAELWAFVYPAFVRKEYYIFDKKSVNFSNLFDSDKISIYIHVPFCVKKCSFCIYYVDNDRSDESMDRYANSLLKEIDYYILKTPNKPYISSLLIWWWTPTLLTPIHINKIISKIKSHFKTDNKSQFTVESTPSQITDDMVKNMLESWVNRISIWVQSFNYDILQDQNRYQKNIIVYNAFKILRKYNFPSINIDLIYGLNKNENIDNFLNDNLVHILKLKPDSIDLYSNQDISNNTNVVDYNVINDINYIIDYVNNKLWKRVITSILNVWIKNINVLDWNFPYNKSKFNYDIRFLLNTISIWIWAVWNFFDKDWKFYYYKFNANNLEEYNKLIELWDFSYKFNHFDYYKVLKMFFIRNIRLWINKNSLMNIFNNNWYIEHIRTILKRIYPYIESNDTNIYLKSNYEDFLPFKFNNSVVNYFIFSFFYLYDDNDRDDFYEKINYYLNDN